MWVPTKNAERETKGERGVNLYICWADLALMTTNISKYFQLILSDVSK